MEECSKRWCLLFCRKIFCLVFLFISATMFVWINGDDRVIFGCFYLITSFLIILHGFIFVALQWNCEIVKRDMVKWWYGRMIVMCQYGFGVKWCNDFCIPNCVIVNQYFCICGEMVKSLYGVMVIWWNCPMLNWFFWDTFLSMVKWWKSEMQFARWNEFFLRS